MAELVGTWTSKSNTVFTGPGFYDPEDELLIEPDLPGISYSFTEDGHYEEALYRVVGNARQHECPIASVTYQHGTYELLSNGSLVLTPIAVDGRQLLSDPCATGNNQSTYTRYVQPTWFKTYQVFVDSYHGRYTLQIYQFDGSMMQPLYLAYKPPLMLPTYALNPTDAASKTKSSLRRRVKRSLENQYRTNAVKDIAGENFEKYWWISVACLGAASSYLFLK
ncbi:suppressor of tor2 [Scheffersomyces stipitis CBS 6054]|uniref:Protein ROT1 n=1 Tax=Scheffersomyces stipitis (strain ATCC 58785 / CBS 6054 / NBRC 10063 / NRRL Y-11545) TaxID=322104 RepID=A3LX76_PICST|nr:suppressor of tor2 [Scheffersomyces stipitis CBS 6054]ABN67755.1 suppressor of tor2 [Scheffersomyces stipitis CBS 6054]